MSVVPREGAGERRSLLRGGGAQPPQTGSSHCGTDAECYLGLLPFVMKVKNAVQISFSQWKQVLNVRLLEKQSGTA